MLTKQPLPYKFSDLSSILSAKEVEIHYEKHTQKYFDKVNELIKGTIYDKLETIEDLLTHKLFPSSGKLFNQACQACLHDMYWANLSPTQTTVPEKANKDKLIEDITTAAELFGSGWIFVFDDFSVQAVQNTGNPHTTNKPVIAVIDVWEHAYLYDERYAADRPKYVERVLSHIKWNLHN